MLKLKDDINLKELLKYGFSRPKYVRAYLKTVKTGREISDSTQYEINLPKREIKIWSLGDINLDLLYDMIQDKLIEKVD